MEELAEDDVWKSIKKFLFRKPTKAELEARAKKIAIFRQQKIEQFEINQTWNFVYGLQKPKRSADVKQLKDITYRNIWMEQNYLFNQIVALNPQERFHDISQYALQWQPPGSEFRLMIPLTDQSIQVEAIKRLRFMTKRQIAKIIFYLTPIKGDMPLYAPNIHKSASESFHDRASVLKKLCEKYLLGVITVSDLHGILEAGLDTWKMALYNILDAEEQQFHRYLLKPPPKLIKKSLERQYLDEDISLQQYDDAKHPIRKAKKDEEALSYPRPYSTGLCIVCRNEVTGLIKCIDCMNLVCIDCIQRVFLDPETSQGSFLLLHRKYCIQFGNLPKIGLDTVPEPSYLHLLRTTGIRTTQVYLEDLKASKRTLDATDLDEIAETMTGISQKSRLPQGYVDDEGKQEGDDDEDSLATATTFHLLSEIRHLVRVIDKSLSKIDSCLITLKEYQAVLDNPRRSQHLQERVARLKEERVSKISATRDKIKRVRQRSQKYQDHSRGSNEYSDLLKRLSEVTEKEGELDRFLEAKTLEEFHEGERKLEEARDAKAKSDLLFQYALRR
jgi:hypothetical protein